MRKASVTTKLLGHAAPKGWAVSKLNIGGYMAVDRTNGLSVVVLAKPVTRAARGMLASLLAMRRVKR